MAESRLFACGNCNHSIEAWSDGNPYYVDRHGKKQYAYHPDKLFDLCVGNDSPHFCLTCGHESLVDSELPATECPKCGESNLVDAFSLDGKACPFCKAGKFVLDPRGRSLS